MKIALCLSGVPRTWQHTHPSLITYFSAHLNQTDVFLHLWNGETGEDIRKLLEDVYNPKAVIMTSRPDADMQKTILRERFPLRPNPFSLDMFEAIKQSIQPALNGDYTHIVRMRYDTIFDGHCPADLFTINSNEIIVPRNFTPPNGCNDQFAIGAVQAMKIYANMIEWLTPMRLSDKAALSDNCFASNADEFRPEQALAAYLENVGLQTKALPLQITLLRESDIGKPFNALPQDVDQGANREIENDKKLRDDGVLGGMPAERGRTPRNRQTDRLDAK